MRLILSSAAVKSNLFVFVSVLFLFLPLFTVAGYKFTLGTAAALFLLAISMPQILKRPRYLGTLAAAWAIPVFIYAGHAFFQTTYALPFMTFFRSYALWALSIAVIWLAFQDRVKFTRVNWTLLFVGTVVFATLQYVDAKFGSGLLLRLIQSLGIYNPLTYATPEQAIGVNLRAIGTYYEPSMLGRVAATLAAIVLVRRPRPVFVAASLALVLAVTQSFSLVVLATGMFVLVFGRASVQSVLLVVIAGAGYYLFGDFIMQRLTFSSASSYSSSYVRLVLPLFALRDILPAYPFGVPIGGNEAVVQQTLAHAFGLAESKITNGFYEFLIYFGLPGLGLVAWLSVRMLRAWSAHDQVGALIIFFLMLSTGASGSMISAESALLLYFLITALRTAGTPVAAPREAIRPVPVSQ